ncbi:hypothetical protein WKR98_15945 [Pigmentiphaga sp. YJ18]|uniref:hypothetical protein n=1 Tax=Pigmentiphaga sp. YJ18 TaxID=3134907 RepID=UPI0031152BD4
MSSMLDRFYEQSARLNTLLNSNPAEAVKQAREINLNLATNERFNMMGLRAAILVDGGALTQQQDAIEEGITLFRELHALFPTADLTYSSARLSAPITNSSTSRD